MRTLKSIVIGGSRDLGKEIAVGLGKVGVKVSL